ncbi:unnamed protein product [Somion occarium]
MTLKRTLMSRRAFTFRWTSPLTNHATDMIFICLTRSVRRNTLSMCKQSVQFLTETKIITQIRISYIIGKEKVKFQWELLRNCVVEHTLCGKDSSNERHIALYAVYAPAEVYFVPVGRLQEKITWTDNNKTLSASLLYGSDDTSEKNVLVDDAGMCNLLQKLENKEMGLEGLFGGEEYYTVLKNLNTKWRAIFGITEEES